MTQRWKVNAHGYDSPYLCKAFIETEDGEPVCGLWEGDGKRARLISAAPDLYEACAMALRFDLGDESRQDDYERAVYAKLRAALAKASPSQEER